MKLVSLELTNYRRFKNASLEFSEGVIGILGMNGVGKSTIIEAIAWVLFGNEQKIVRTKKEDLKRFGASHAEPCEVVLEFELDGDRYRVNRKMAGKNFQTTADVLVNGTSVASTTKAVTELVQTRLGMDYQAFYTSVFAKQKELNALSDLDPNRRRRLVLRMLNIDSLDKAITNVRRDAKSYETRMSELRSTLVDEEGRARVDVARSRVTELEEELKTVSEVITEQEKEKTKLEGELKSLEAFRNQMRKRQEGYNKLNTKLAEVELNIKNATKHLNRLDRELEGLVKQREQLAELQPKDLEWKETKKCKEELEGLHAKFIRATELNVQLEKISKQIKRNGADLIKFQTEHNKFSGLEQQKQRFESLMKALKDELESKQSIISEKTSKLELVGSEITMLNEKLVEIRSLGPESNCPTCERVLGEHYKVLEDKFEAELNGLVEKQNGMRKSMDSEVELLNDAKKRQEALTKQERYLAAQDKELARLEQKIEHMTLECDRYNDSRTELQEKLEEYKGLVFDIEVFNKIKNQFAELERVHEQIITLKNNVENIPEKELEISELKSGIGKFGTEKVSVQNELESLGFDQVELNELETKFEDKAKILKDLELELKSKEHEANLYNKEIEQLKNNITELEKREKTVQEYRDELVYRNKLYSVLNSFKSYMISRIAPTLTQYASELFRELTDGRYNRMEVDNDYNIFIFDQGEEFPLSRFSGGEEDLANLCLRLAISQVITSQTGTSGPSFVILDEVFGSQDVHRKRNLLQALNSLTNRFRQIFVITHIEDVKEYIENYIQVTEIDEQASSAQILGG